MTDAKQDAADDAQRLAWANADDAARKAATDAHYPEFDEHAEAYADDRRSSRVWTDGVTVIPVANKGPTP
jgi:hypothetical protein